MDVPKSYEGREQSLLKHRVLWEYLIAWAMKLGSIGRGREVRLCYVDGFAGPWGSVAEDMSDTSIVVGLTALNEAATQLTARGLKVRFEATFIEREQREFARLERAVSAACGVVYVQTFRSEFGATVAKLRQWMSGDPALVFVDPKGWKGAEMRHIAPLLGGTPRRDVLINVMYDHVNRFKDDEREFLKTQMREFFGVKDAELPEGMTERALFAFYRQQLKTVCGCRYAADLAVPYPDRDRTKFGLVIGGGHEKVIELFRSVEHRVMGQEAPGVLGRAEATREEKRTTQLGLPLSVPVPNLRYDTSHDAALREAPTLVERAIRERGPVRFGAIWPTLLEELHMKKSELGTVAWSLCEAGTLTIEKPRPRQHTVVDDDVLCVPRGRADG